MLRGPCFFPKSANSMLLSTSTFFWATAFVISCFSCAICSVVGANGTRGDTSFNCSGWRIKVARSSNPSENAISFDQYLVNMRSVQQVITDAEYSPGLKLKFPFGDFVSFANLPD